jgi:hypothetical protein
MLRQPYAVRLCLLGNASETIIVKGRHDVGTKETIVKEAIAKVAITPLIAAGAVLAACMVAACMLSGCISSSSPPEPAKTTVVVPANGTTTVVCQDGTRPPCN